MAVGIELERVQRTSGGRVHLTPHVPDFGPVVTLCGQTFPEGTYRGTGAEADCRNCLRRKDDPGRVSSAFFQSDVGLQLLQRSLDEARARGERPPPRPRVVPAPPSGGRAQRRQRPEVRPPEPPGPGQAEMPAERPAVNGLRSRTPLRRMFENVYVSPEGVILRLSDGEVRHVTFEGSVDVRRRGRTLVVRVGDVELAFPTG